MPGIVRNCLLTSSIIWNAAFPTDSIVNAENKNGSIPPINRPIITLGSNIEILLNETASA